MAIVYLAVDTKFGRRVAIKVLRAELTQTLAVARFFREVDVTARLNHPHVLPLLDAGQAGDEVFYVMPYVDGESLKARLAREKRLPIVEAVRIASEIADALTAAHKQGIIHRDITPANILLQANHALVSDFGIARAVSEAQEDALTGSGLVLGTAGYMSPEQAAGDTAIDGRSDVFSLGCVLYEMLTGEPPVTGASPRAVLATKLVVKPVSSVIGHTPLARDVEAILERALARRVADRFASAEEFEAALSALRTGTPLPFPKRYQSWARRSLVWIGALVVIAVLIGFVARWFGRVRPYDSTLVAVAPFDVYDRNLTLWGEGFMDILSANLEGAGPLRAVSPTISLRRWNGRADRPSAVALANATQARFVIVGRVVSAGPDSMRVTAFLFDAGSRSDPNEINVVGARDRAHIIADALAGDILRRLGQSVESRQGRLTFGTASLPALKSFLRGEYFLRRTQWDSAAAAYGDAITSDGSFTLAYWRMKTARWSQSWGPDTAGDTYALEAGRRNHGLAPRDSLLVTVDSLWASLSRDDLGAWGRMRRLGATLDEAALRYPDDPWIWYKIGEARFHLPLGLDYSLEDELKPFDRAIALDSGFALPYVSHPIELSLILHGPERALLYTKGFELIALPGIEDSAARFTGLLMRPPYSGSQDSVPLPSGISADVLYRVAANLDMWFDSGEVALRVARRLVAQHSGSERFVDRETAHLRLARILGLRGHLKEAWFELRQFTRLDQPQDETLELFADLALLDVVPAAEADSIFKMWTHNSPRGTIFALPWWSRMGDTVGLKRAAMALQRRVGSPPELALAQYGRLAVQAYSALARGDTVSAQTAFARLADSLCADCFLDWRTRGELWLSAGDLVQAKQQLERVRTYAWNVPSYPLASLLLGRVAERSNDVDGARKAYRTVRNAWIHADSSLSQYVDEARAGLLRVGN
jgi:serine/threonine-protein kinase